MTTTPEFSRPWRLDRIGGGEQRDHIEATTEERAALARRFGLKALHRLEAEFAIRRDAQGVRAHGRVSAEVEQACVATGEAVPAAIDSAFDLRFLPEPETAADEVELDSEECDTIFFEGGAVDLGEAAAQTLALALDPWPRAPHAAEVLRAAGVVSEEEARPFGALAGLKARLEKGE